MVKISNLPSDTSVASNDLIPFVDVSQGTTEYVTKENLLGAVDSEGWRIGLLPAVSSVTENGNRSADVLFASTIAAILSVGMKFRTTRTVAAPTYMGGLFNGTNHYFTKVTATSTLSTVTNNFTIMGWAEPVSYGTAMCIAGRVDAAGNNGIILQQDTNGQIMLWVINAAGANFRKVSTVQSVPLNKKTHVAASWSSGTVVIYFDGVAVPVGTAVTGGTAPTTAGTGGDFSIGRYGANNGGYYAGYISGVGVFNAVLSAATIKSYKNQALLGSETNCIGAWSLNNTGVNQQAAGTNDLTATNSVGYTSGHTPYCTDSTGVGGGSYDYAIVMKVSGSTATVQYPEGCAIPTIGGISAVAYSTHDIPSLFPRNKNQWEVSMIIGNNTSSSGTVTNTVYNPGGANLNLPIGAWSVLLSGAASSAQNASFPAVSMGLSTSNSAFTNTLADFFQRDYNQSATTSNTFLIPIYRTSSLTVSVATPLYILVMSEQPISGLGLRGALSSSTQPEQTRVVATPACL